jgi:acetylornithine deacetylase/succinyl-diaminopimelate desuccinylase-like protein
MAMEAALMLKELGLIPRRTIRVVLFTNEENGLGGAKAYYEAHKDERHVAAIEADSGSAAPWGFGVGRDQADLDGLAPYAQLFAGLGADNFVLGGGGADISPLTRDGVLGIALRPDTSHYFDLHHSPADTVDKIAPYHLERNAAAMALMAYILAELQLPSPPPAKPDAQNDEQ